MNVTCDNAVMSRGEFRNHKKKRATDSVALFVSLSKRFFHPLISVFSSMCSRISR